MARPQERVQERRFDPVFLADLRDRTPLAELVGRSVDLRRSGRTQVGCCPFHGERTPSFHVYKDHFNCYGCGARGDAIEFVRQRDRVPFPDAVARLAAEAGMDLPGAKPRATTPQEHARREAAAAERARQLEAKRAAAERADAEREAFIACKASAIWAKSAPAPADHPYLARKGVEPYDLRVDRKGNLLVPLRDDDGKLWNLQTISPEGKKLTLWRKTPDGPEGGRTKGLHYTIGKIEGAPAIVVAEGFATSASIHADTGLPTRMAFSGSNLLPVVQGLRERHSELPILIGADNDHQAPRKNPPRVNQGIAKAEEAAAAVSGVRVVAPAFEATDPGKDWNDHRAKHGPGSLAPHFRAAPAAPTTEKQMSPEIPIAPERGDIPPVHGPDEGHAVARMVKEAQQPDADPGRIRATLDRFDDAAKARISDRTLWALSRLADVTGDRASLEVVMLAVREGAEGQIKPSSDIPIVPGKPPVYTLDEMRSMAAQVRERSATPPPQAADQHPADTVPELVARLTQAGAGDRRAEAVVSEMTRSLAANPDAASGTEYLQHVVQLRRRVEEIGRGVPVGDALAARLARVPPLPAEGPALDAAAGASAGGKSAREKPAQNKPGADEAAAPQRPEQTAPPEQRQPEQRAGGPGQQQGAAQAGQTQTVAGRPGTAIGGALASIFSALRPPQPDTPPQWQEKPHPLGDRLREFEERRAATVTGNLQHAAEQAGERARRALEALSQGPGSAVLAQIKQAAAGDPDGMRGVVAGMQPGGKYADLRSAFNDALVRERAFFDAFDRAVGGIAEYGTARVKLNEGLAARRMDTAVLDKQFGEMDREIGQAAETLPGRKSGQSAYDELAAKAKKLAEFFADVIERAKNAIRPTEAPGQAPAPKAAPAPAMAPSM